jgi:DNA-binding transcriptional MerR regulator
MSARGLRIGEVAERVGVTTRTIRYYEERGLLGRESQREKGAHRLYGEADVVRLQELIRLLELAEAEEARTALRGQWAESATDEERAEIVEAAIPLVERQLELLASRQQTLAAFSDELKDKLTRLKRRRRSLSAIQRR